MRCSSRSGSTPTGGVRSAASPAAGAAVTFGGTRDADYRRTDPVDPSVWAGAGGTWWVEGAWDLQPTPEGNAELDRPHTVEALGDHTEGQRVGQHLVVPGEVADRQQVDAGILLQLPVSGTQLARVQGVPLYQAARLMIEPVS